MFNADTHDTNTVFVITLTDTDEHFSAKMLMETIIFREVT